MIFSLSTFGILWQRNFGASRLKTLFEMGKARHRVGITVKKVESGQIGIESLRESASDARANKL